MLQRHHSHQCSVSELWQVIDSCWLCPHTGEERSRPQGTWRACMSCMKRTCNKGTGLGALGNPGLIRVSPSNTLSKCHFLQSFDLFVLAGLSFMQLPVYCDTICGSQCITSWYRMTRGSCCGTISDGLQFGSGKAQTQAAIDELSAPAHGAVHYSECICFVS